MERGELLQTAARGGSLMKEYTFDVLPEYVGGFGSVTTGAVVRLFQRAATRHSHDLGYTSTWLIENNAAWVAREHHLERLEPLPTHGTVTVRTTVEDMRRVRSLRSYEIRDSEDDTPLALGTTVWVFLDRDRGRVSRIPEDMKNRYDVTAGDDTSPKRRQLESPELPEVDFERTYNLQFRDLDELGHVNNVVYVEYLFETLLRATLQKRDEEASGLPETDLKLDRLSIRYLNQTQWGKPLTCRVARGPSGGRFVFQLKQSDETTAEGEGDLKEG